MSTLLETQSELGQSTSTDASDLLRSTTAACRVSFKWFGTTKSLTDEQKATAARSFGADQSALSAGKKLLDTAHPAYRRVNSVKSRINGYWKAETLPFPEPGLRLIRQDSVDSFNRRMDEFEDELNESVRHLDDTFSQLKDAASIRLGELYSSADYPTSLIGLFGVSWDFPSVEVPEFLRRINPTLYRQESERVARRFDQALELAESAFLEELKDLIEHLTERLTGDTDGKPKVFRDTVVTNLTEFFNRFRRLNVRSNNELEELVETCQQIVGGRTPQSLRDNKLIRDTVAAEMSEVGNRLDALLVDRPRRNLIRKAR